MRVAFGTVVYNSAVVFSEDYALSINRQICTTFDVILINDDLLASSYNELAENISRNVIQVQTYGRNSISENRIRLISEALNRGYDLLVLGDFDDTMCENRVNNIVINFDAKYGFYYNDIVLYQTQKKLFSKIPLTVKNFKAILESNFLGLSNTALNLKSFDKSLLKTLRAKQSDVFDWMLFTILTLHGCKGKKVSDCQTFYRIHSSNIAGASTVSSVKLAQEFNVKIEHYSKLTDIAPTYVWYLEFYNELYEIFKKNPEYILKKSMQNNGYWWGRIQSRQFMGED